MGHFHFASSTAHSPWTALRVRWVPLYHFPTLSLRAFAMCAAFPRSDYYAQFDCRQGLGVSYGSPHFYSPPSLTSLAGSPVFTVEDSKRNAVGGVFLLAPSTLCGFPDKNWVSGLTGWHHRQGMPGCSFPEGLCTLLVNHHVISQPSTAS